MILLKFHFYCKQVGAGAVRSPVQNNVLCRGTVHNSSMLDLSLAHNKLSPSLGFRSQGCLSLEKCIENVKERPTVKVVS